MLTPAELDEISDPNIIINKMITLETQCAQMKPNLGAIAEYKKKVCTDVTGSLLPNYSPLLKLTVTVVNTAVLFDVFSGSVGSSNAGSANVWSMFSGTLLVHL